MRAAVLHELGADPVVGEFEEPQDGEGALVVDVLAAGLNPIDLRRASGVLAGAAPPVPSVVGSEGIGRTADGRRVYFSGCVAPWGSLAERALIEPDAIEVPDGIEDAHAVCYGIAGTAAYGALTRRGRLQEGERVLVLGASGVVGLIAVQLARLLGARTVVAAARSAAGLERARERGADATVTLDRGGTELTEAITDAAGGQVDLVIDPLWGEPAAAALEALAPEGRLVMLGQSAGDTATFSPVSLRFRELSILGYTNFRSSPEHRREALTRMWEWAAQGDLRADHESLPLDQAPEAWHRQASSPNVKLVVSPQA
jgi:NADPH2:quinone reductase